MPSKHDQASNGAIVTTYKSRTPGPSSLVVAGQHGSETGPIHGCLGWEPGVRRGSLTIIKMANPFGINFGCRHYRASDGENRDLNRDWGVAGTLAEELWTLALAQGGPFDTVIDLHSSPDHRVRGLGLTVLASSPEHMGLAEELAGVLAEVEEGWRAWSPGAWDLQRMRDKTFAGTLTGHASACGATSVTVEFSDGYPKSVPVAGRVAGEYVSEFANTDNRKRSIHERMRGVFTLLNHIEGMHR